MIYYNYNIKITPGVLSSDLISFPYTSDTTNGALSYNFNAYTGLTYLVTGNTNTCGCNQLTCGICASCEPSSLITGLTIPIYLTQKFNDIGYYSEFDGNVLQKDIITNFLYSANTFNPYLITLYDTSGDPTVSLLTQTTFYVDWGDGSATQQLTSNQLTHTYINDGQFTITFSGTNLWGTSVVEKPISIPLTGVTVTNPLGTYIFNQQGGAWSSITNSYNYIFTGDSVNTCQAQASSGYTTVPFLVSGFTVSRLNDLKRWGPQPYTPGYVITKKGSMFGMVDQITTDYTSYTINNISYYDFTNGRTLYVMSSSGITCDDINLTKITKDEYLLDFVSAPEIITDVYLERGKYSPFENLNRLGEVDNTGDLQKYGYGFFKINNA